MRSVLKIILFFYAINLPLFLVAQSASVVDRTPEQEAVKQTEKLQKELSLTPDQAKEVYEINLKYARERKQSNKRSDAVNRIRLKNEEIGKVLNERQNFELRTKRSEIQSVEINGKRQFTRTDARTRVIPQNDEKNPGNQLQDRPVRSSSSLRQSNPDSPTRMRSANDNEDRAVRGNNNNINTGRTVRDYPSGQGDRSSTLRSSEQRSTSSSGSSSSQQPVRDSRSRR